MLGNLGFIRMLTDEQAKIIKEQLFKQIESLPIEQREQAKTYIKSLNNKQLEEFLIKNKLIKQPGVEAGAQPIAKPTKCVFCAIANKQIEALAIYEDKDYIAVLEIKPFSKGHVVLIPKKHIKKTKSLPSKAFTIANRIGKHIVKQLKAESFHLTTASEMNHSIINIIPTYKKQPLTYERKPAKKQELQELAIKIGEVKKREAPIKKQGVKIAKSKIKEAIIKLPERVP